MENKELNLFDLIALSGKACMRGIKKIINLLSSMLRITYRQWWIVLIALVLAVSAGMYYASPSKRWYNADAVLILNGPTTAQVKQALDRVSKTAPFTESQNTAVLLKVDPTVARIKSILTYNVIDCMNDSTADFIDYKEKIPYTDTMNVVMKDRVGVRICMRNPNCLPYIEQALLNYLNEIPQMQSSYESYYSNLLTETEYCHRQLEKLDSLTSDFYFNQSPSMQLGTDRKSSSLYVGDRRIRLFLDQINAHIHHMNYMDMKLINATAPVVVENHFVLNPHAINGRLKMLIISVLLGWILGCLIAAAIEQRKAIIAWLKK